jgi:hypothetical protein
MTEPELMASAGTARHAHTRPVHANIFCSTIPLQARLRGKQHQRQYSGQVVLLTMQFRFGHSPSADSTLPLLTPLSLYPLYYYQKGGNGSNGSH